MEVLFINSCLRSKGISRTYALASYFISEYETLHPDYRITHLDLSSSKLFPLTYFDMNMQLKDSWSKQHHAQQFVKSDKIVIAAPIWNLGCPSVLNVYLEHICLAGTTYKHTKDGYIGLCSGKKVLYISTMGTNKSPGDTIGIEYIKAVFARLGINEFEHICVDGVDITGSDTERRFKDAIKKCESIAENW